MARRFILLGAAAYGEGVGGIIDVPAAVILRISNILAALGDRRRREEWIIHAAA